MGPYSPSIALMRPRALSSASISPRPSVIRVRTQPGCRSWHQIPRSARSMLMLLLTMLSAALLALYAYPFPLPLSSTLPTFDVTFPTSETGLRDPGSPMSPRLTSCWVTSSGPMVFILYTCIISSAVMSSSSHLLYPSVPVVPALLMTTSMDPPCAWTGSRAPRPSAQLAIEVSSATSRATTARRDSPTSFRSAARSSAAFGSRQDATTELPGDLVRICLQNSRPIPRFAPVTRTHALAIFSPGTYFLSTF
mmetsp:Transcript_10154/g.39665  ORF Transcript_10154/g.39665 Transcript_10154/m.39665 type:complete len:251 (+) Transcript_10154:78-830(+)